MSLSSQAKTVAKRALFESGALSLYRRTALARTLTIVMFHRVMPESDPRYSAVDPEYTMTLDIFECCLAAFESHYNIVPLADIAAAADGQQRLPDRALLITLDDGWEDTARYAAPALRKRKLPSVVFVASGALTVETTLWRDVAACLWRAEGEGGALRREHQKLEALTARLGGLGAAERDAWLSKAIDAKSGAIRPLMMSVNNLSSVLSDGMAVGGHGASHTPLTEVGDLPSELTRCADELAAAAGHRISAFSFPNGCHSPVVVEAVRDAGFSLQFSSDPCLNPTGGARLPSLLGRLNIPQHAIVDARGTFVPEKLAYWLTARPVRSLG